MTQQKPKLAMIGLDAADLQFIRQHLDVLPTLRRLFEASEAHSLQTTAKHLAGSVWPTFYTGSMPGEHGIYHHLQWDAAAASLRRVRADWLYAEPFWYPLERSGLDVIAIDVPMTFPSRLERGVEVINWGSHDTLSAFNCRPASLRREILKRFGRHPMGCEIPVNKSAAELEKIRANLVAGAGIKGGLSRWLAETRPWDLFVTIFGETHRGGHILWPEDVFGDGIMPTPDALVSVYRAVDAAVEHLLESPSMKEAKVIVFALHGMGRNISQEHFMPQVMDRANAKFRDPSLHMNGTAPATAGQRSLMRTLREKIPARLQNVIAKSVPVGVRDLVVNRSISGGHDWPQTLGVNMLADLHGYVRYNLRGREANGAINNDDPRFHEYADWIKRCFMSLRVSDTGKPLVNEIIDVKQIYPGARNAFLPDLIVSWNPAAPAKRVDSDLIGTITAELATGRSGNHRPEGFCLIPKGVDVENAPAHISDLALVAQSFLASAATAS